MSSCPVDCDSDGSEEVSCDDGDSSITEDDVEEQTVSVSQSEGQVLEEMSVQAVQVRVGSG